MGTIVVPEHFIQATRDTGYRSLGFALAELIDNAIDAGASEVDIRIVEERPESERQITIGVLDNGRGMDKSNLRKALRFGGSERFNARSSLGRFGMGLPNSSVSQAPRVDVYTWRDGRTPLRTHLDVDAIASRRASGIPEPRCAPLPEWAPDRPPSGTMVQWSHCDRLRFKKASTLARKLRPTLGRMYRVALTNGLSISINGEAVAPVDPLFRVPMEGLSGTCQPYGEPLDYRVKTPGGGTSTVTVQFVELPVSEWHALPAETKRAAGIVGGAGMSVLRGGREIDYRWTLFGGKRRENYDDWWRAELRFDPALDELVGITHSKQGINPTPEFREILEPDLERVARRLNARAREAFKRVRPSRANLAVERASAADRLLPGVQGSRHPVRRPTCRGFHFRMGFHQEARSEFFTADVRGSVLQVNINQNHPFYQKLYMHSQGSVEDIDLLLLSAARALLDLAPKARKTLLRSWSDNLLAYLGQ